MNAKHGRFAVRSGTTLYLPAVYADPANNYDVCDVRGTPEEDRRLRTVRHLLPDGWSE